MDEIPDPVPTPRMERILRMASDEARARRHPHVGVEHLVLAILDEGRSVPAQLLARQIPLAEVRAPIDELMRSDAYGRPSL